jgi:DNA-binding beta-propeller fold protein YncE
VPRCFASITRTLPTVLALTALIGGSAEAVASGPQAGAARPPTLYVVNTNEGSASSTVSVINASTGAFIKSIRVEFNATAIATAPNGRTAYVASPDCGACMAAARGLAPLYGTITPISTAANKAVKPILAAVNEIVITPDSKTAYVADRADQDRSRP